MFLEVGELKMEARSPAGFRLDKSRRITSLSRVTNAPHGLFVSAVAGLFAWHLYRRVRRDLDRQKLKPVRMVCSIVDRTYYRNRFIHSHAQTSVGPRA